MNIATLVLLLLAFIDSIGFGLIVPMMVLLMFDPAWQICDPNMTSTMKGFWTGLLFCITPLVQFLLSPPVGALSDRVGRRPVILGCVALGSLGYIAAAIAVAVKSLIGLVCARAVIGVGITSFAVLNAGLADMSGSLEQKSRHFSWVNMAFGFGFVVGPILGGILVLPTCFWDLSVTRPFIVAAILTVINLVMLYWWLPETCRHEDTQERSTWSLDSSMIWFLFAVFFLYCGISSYNVVLPIVWAEQLSLSHGTISWLLSYGAAWYVGICFCIVPLLTKRIDAISLLSIGLLGMVVVSFCIWSCVTWRHAIWPLVALKESIVALVMTVGLTAASEKVSADYQGRVLGLYGAAESIGYGIGPIIIAPMYGIAMRLPFFACIILFSIACLCLCYSRYLLTKQQKSR